MNKRKKTKNVKFSEEDLSKEDFPLIFLKKIARASSESEHLLSVVLLYTIKKYDINRRNNRNETILSIFLKLTKSMSISPKNQFNFVRRLFALGYNQEIEITGNEEQTISTQKKSQERQIEDEIKEIFENRKRTGLSETFLIGSGGNGEVYSTFDFENRKVLALKFDNYEEDYHSDIYKEMMVSNYVNSKVENVTFKNYGVKLSSRNNVPFLIMEFGICDLKKLFEELNKYPDSISKPLILKLFKEVTRITCLLHQVGILHLDLKHLNIMVMPDLSLRIIDFGTSLFAGIGNEKISRILSTENIKPPDDSDYQLKYKIDDIEIFNDNPNNKITYTYDVYSIGCMLFQYIIGTSDKMALFTKGEFYTYSKNYEMDQILLDNYVIRNFQEMDIKYMKKMNDFNEHTLDFLVKTLCADSELRYTAKEALTHELFGGNENLKFEIPISVPEIEDFDFSQGQMSKNSGKLKYLYEFYEHHKDVKVKKYVDGNLAHKVGRTDDFSLNLMHLLGGKTQINGDLERLIENKNSDKLVNVFKEPWLTLSKQEFTEGEVNTFYNEFSLEGKDLIMFSDLINCFIVVEARKGKYDYVVLEIFYEKIFDYLHDFMQNVENDITVFEIFENFISEIYESEKNDGTNN